MTLSETPSEEEEEEDLEAEIERARNQNQSRTQNRRRDGAHQNSGTARAGPPGGGEETDHGLAAALIQVGNIMARSQSQHSQETREFIKTFWEKMESGEGGKKRKKDDEWKPQEKVLGKVAWNGADQEEDDSHEKLAWGTRAHLMNPNAPPEKWWGESVPTKTGPMLGGNLCMEAFMPGRINDQVACKLYDRTEPLELKHLLTKNSGHLGALKQKYKTDYSSGGSVSTSIETDFKGSSDCWEAVEGVLKAGKVPHSLFPWPD